MDRKYIIELYSSVIVIIFFHIAHTSFHHCFVLFDKILCSLIMLSKGTEDLGRCLWKKKGWLKVNSLLTRYFNLFLRSFRKSVPLERMVKVTIWMSGLYYVGVLYGSGMSRYASSTVRQKHCCRWRANSTAGPFKAREKCTRWPAAASTVTGKPWRAFSWSPVKRVPKTSAVRHTPSCDCFHPRKQFVSQQSVFFMFCLHLCSKNLMQKDLSSTFQMWQITLLWLKSTETLY